DDDASANAQKEEQKNDSAVAARLRKGEERAGDAEEAEDETDLVALRIEQRADGERGDHQAEGLGESYCPVLRGREVEALGEVGEDSAEHGGDHSVNEDGEDGGEDEHGV